MSKKYDFFWPIACLLLVELITFGINLGQVGVYQDEWISFEKLYFVPHTFFSLISVYFWDPRIIIRPIEVLHFAPLFFFFGTNPLWYHIVCYLFEFLGGVFLFLTLNKFSGDRLIALICAILFLLYPTHDSTHYEIVASSLPVSMTLFNLSLWLYLKGIEEKNKIFITWSVIANFLSIYNYEFCLPLIILYPVLYLLYLPLRQKNFKSFVAYQMPYLLVLISMILYRKWLLPSLGLGYHYATAFSLSNFLSVLWSGFIVNLSPYTVQFCLSMIFDCFRFGLPIFYWFALLLTVIFISISLLKEKDSPVLQNKNWSLVFLGIITLLSSYTIYGFSPEHMPVIDTWLNRVNVGGSLGACLFLAGLLGWYRNFCFSLKQTKVFVFTIAAIAGLLIMVDWQFAQPWIVSWQSQKQLMFLLKKHSNEIGPEDSIIIGDINRYASKWTPIVDGVWDFQAIVRTTLNNQKLKATVVTERLSIENQDLVDSYHNLILGKFPFAQMNLYSADRHIWTRICSRQEFFEQAKKFGWQIPNFHSDQL